MKLVISVLGSDTVGIIASVSQVLAQRDVNILTLKQTIVDDIFTMIIICETKKETGDAIVALQDDFKAVEADKGVQIKVQHMDIFRSMHQLD